MRYWISCKEGASCDFLRGLIPEDFVEDAIAPEVVFVVGGDGTILKTIQKFVNKLSGVRFIGVNTGYLGFLSSCSADGLSADDFAAVLEQPGASYRLLEVSGKFGTVYAVNEMRVESAEKTLRAKVSIDGVEFEEIWGSGVLVCSKLGSSAYNRSLGGAVMTGEGLQLTEIAGVHHQGQRSLGASLVLPDAPEITLEVSGASGMILGYDAASLPFAGGTVKVKLGEKEVKLVRDDSVMGLRRLF